MSNTNTGMEFKSKIYYIQNLRQIKEIHYLVE